MCTHSRRTGSEIRRSDSESHISPVRRRFKQRITRIEFVSTLSFVEVSWAPLRITERTESEVYSDSAHIIELPAANNYFSSEKLFLGWSRSQNAILGTRLELDSLANQPQFATATFLRQDSGLAPGIS